LRLRQRFGFQWTRPRLPSGDSTSQPSSNSRRALTDWHFLHALSLADVPWAKVGTEGKKRECIQTVNFRSVRGRTILMRAYDKGIESGVASPGELIRFERQRRYHERDELSVSVPSISTSDGSSLDASSRRSWTSLPKSSATNGERSID